MSARDLIAILPVPNVPEPPEGLTAIGDGAFTAIFGKSRLSRGLTLTRKAALKGSVDRQRQLEALMGFGTVLPVLPGMTLKTDEVSAVLTANHTELTQAATSMAGLVQFQISVAWDQQTAEQKFGSSDDVLDRQTTAFRTTISQALEKVAKVRQELPRDKQTISNDVLLIDAEREVDLDAAVEQIDALWTEGLKIRQIGPSPAVSFCSLGIRRIPRRQVTAAMKVFGFDALPSEEDLTQARHAALKSSDPHQQESIRSAASLITYCNKAKTTSPPPQIFIWREGQASQSIKDVA